jgi:nucleotide-binding universal stress UspA family protein/predicted transcriptional regulator
LIRLHRWKGHEMMEFPFRRILCPVALDDSAMEALGMAADIARQNDGTIFVLHVVPMSIEPVDSPVYVHLYKDHRQTARSKLEEIGRQRLAGLTYQVLTEIGDPAEIILKVEKRERVDLVVIRTHGRAGLARLLLGSVAERVLRQSSCPALVVRHGFRQKHLVGAWMTRNPVTAAPDESLSSIRDKLIGGPFQCIPIVRGDSLIGIVSERDIQTHAGYLDETEACTTMREPLVTVHPMTTIREAARLLSECQLGTLPVVEEGKLAGVITTADLLATLAAEACAEALANGDRRAAAWRLQCQRAAGSPRYLSAFATSAPCRRRFSKHPIRHR